MTTIAQMQAWIARLGTSCPQSGVYDVPTRAAVLDVLTTDGGANALSPQDYVAAASTLGCDVPSIRAVRRGEAGASGFSGDRSLILFEPHRFSRATGHVYDATHPHISYPVWDPKKYPAKQSARYDQLLEAVGLSPDAGFASASYGLFQILGENFLACGYSSPMVMARQQSLSEGDQLEAFVNFVMSNRTMLAALRSHDWATFARLYNGTAYRQNHYDTRLAQFYHEEGGR